MGAKYEIGRGKPPKQCQFKKGQSGYPQGRPKGSKSTKAVFDQVRRQRVPFHNGDRKGTVTVEEAFFMNLYKTAIQGNMKACELLPALLQAFGMMSPEGSQTRSPADGFSRVTWTELHESMRPYLEHLRRGDEPITDAQA